MLAKAWSSALQGVDSVTVEVEVNATEAGNDDIVNVVGLPDTAVRESRDRVWSALCCSGFDPPRGRTTINLAPADLRKEGASFDLPIAMGMVAATNGFDRANLRSVMMVGELALDGSVRPIRGALPVAMHARQQGMRDLLVPTANAGEAGVVRGLNVYGVGHLLEAVEFLRGQRPSPPTVVDVQELYSRPRPDLEDFGEIKGQESAKRAMEVAAAGGHNVLMIGPPGGGKTMLAKRLPTVLPPLTLEEAFEVTRIHSVAGVLEPGSPLVVVRPFRSPHHTISDAGLLGGQSMPRPGEISLAHNGVLFLDELPEFRRNALEVLRQPLESGDVTISRASGSVTFPAKFMLVAAMNPCPCGHYGSLQRRCRCGSAQIQRYRSKVSGPLLDRIDLHVEVSAITERELLGRAHGESSATLRDRVRRARAIQRQRFAGTGVRCNAEMTPRLLEQHCGLGEESRNYLRLAINDLHLSARAYDRILRVARTLADLEGTAAIQPGHITEAIQYRALDRQMW